MSSNQMKMYAHFEESNKKVWWKRVEPKNIASICGIYEWLNELHGNPFSMVHSFIHSLVRSFYRSLVRIQLSHRTMHNVTITQYHSAFFLFSSEKLSYSKWFIWWWNKWKWNCFLNSLCFQVGLVESDVYFSESVCVCMCVCFLLQNKNVKVKYNFI